MKITFSFFQILRLLCITAFLFFSQTGVAQSKASEPDIAQDFIRFLASKGERVNRVDKVILPWKLSEIYLNDSLWSIVNLTDNNRIMARTGFFGAGPLLKYDYKFTPRDFQKIKKEIANAEKLEWSSSDFQDSIIVLQDKGLGTAAYYAFSQPLVFPDKKLVLVKRYYHSEKRGNRWSAVEVYRIVKPGEYQLVNTYLRTDM